MASQGYWGSGCERKPRRVFRVVTAVTSLRQSPHDAAMQWRLMSR